MKRSKKKKKCRAVSSRAREKKKQTCEIGMPQIEIQYRPGEIELPQIIISRREPIGSADSFHQRRRRRRRNNE